MAQFGESRYLRLAGIIRTEENWSEVAPQGVVGIQVADEPVFADEITSNRMASAYFQCHIDIGLASEHA